ncbi:MAG: hypothetical protein FJ276_22910 [Planctomycetes bacterium]|nr:hypothetical protein [Planctomycetota bacterium]
MAEEQDRQDDLNALEAALAALTPRSDGLNRDRLMFLAGQASAAERNGGSAGGVESGTRLRHWSLPAAFVAMTGVAACLLVALVARPPLVVERVVERIVEVPAAPTGARLALEQRRDRDTLIAETQAPAPRRFVEQPSVWFALLLATFARDPSAALSSADASSYLRLRDRAFSQGLEGWTTPAAVAAVEVPVSSRSRPASQRELLDELLEKAEADRGADPAVSPESTSHPGVKS